MSICVTRHIEFEAAHMLLGYDGLCSSLHGHSYKLEVTITCPNHIRNKFGFVMDFKNLNSILKNNVPDHCFMYNKNTPVGSVEYEVAKTLKDNNCRVWEIDGYPSAENMSAEFAHMFQTILDTDYPELQATVVELKLWETTDSYATWKPDKE